MPSFKPKLIGFNGHISKPNSLLFMINYTNTNLNIWRNFSSQVGKLKNPMGKYSEIPTLPELERKVFNKQLKLVKLAEKYGQKHPRVQRFIEILVRSFPFRMLAVFKVAGNSGSKTPGIDGFLFKDISDKYQMAEHLLNLLKTYKVSPLKRVFIPKGNNKTRPLGIPTIQDRCIQNLVKLVLEPLVEITSDLNSYGYRKLRSAKNAIGALRSELKSNSHQENKYILDADIKGFFDNINHE